MFTFKLDPVAGTFDDGPLTAFFASHDALDATEHRAVFEVLRKWRNERAKRDGRPPYVLFTNSQLANLARGRPDTRAALEAVHATRRG